jgi:hypothetical protein
MLLREQVEGRVTEGMYTFVASEETSGNLLLNLTYKKSSYQINIWNKM